MCRYACYGPYKQHYACFVCRKVFREPDIREKRYASRSVNATPREHPCPQCRRPMAAMGLDFKAPKQSDVRQWKKVEILFSHGYAYHSCGCNGPGPRPADLRDVESFLMEDRERIVENERLVAVNRRASDRQSLRQARAKTRATKQQATNR